MEAMENGVPISDRGNYGAAILTITAGILCKLLGMWLLMSTATIREGFEHVFLGERDAPWRALFGTVLNELAWVLLAIGGGYALISFWFRSRSTER
jgi:hypothetical protein